MKPDESVNVAAVRELSQSLALPAYAHVPGSNDRPPEGFLDHILEKLPETTTSENAGSNVGWHYALRLMQEGYFWEAHEVLEAVWMRAPHNSRERSLVQGVIHLTNAYLKRVMYQENAKVRLVEKAEECFERAFRNAKSQPVMDLHLSDLVGLIDRTGASKNDRQKNKNA